MYMNNAYFNGKNMEVLTSRRLVIACFSRAQIRSSHEATAVELGGPLVISWFIMFI